MNFLNNMIKNFKNRDKSSNPFTKEGITKGINEDRYMNLAIAKRNWQIAAFICLTVIAVQDAHIVNMASKSHVEPFVVELNNGQPVNVQRATALDSSEKTKLVEILLKNYIVNSRTVTNDENAEKALLDKVYAYTADGAVTYLNDYYKVNDPFKEAGLYTVLPNIVNALQLSQNTWQISWDEPHRSVNDGSLITNERYVAQLTIKQTSPDQDNIANNPFGVYITQLAWSKSQ